MRHLLGVATFNEYMCVSESRKTQIPICHSIPALSECLVSSQLTPWLFAAYPATQISMYSSKEDLVL
ncbi:hypothetical protein JTE90_005792 [Oedothorax gibbosus]|uniref:Uncharacterized protein n=1 Tax=Oedothorax gibbosus TaxID=931172 RepID=A0AAV6TRJ3_9ARAC|nr:hypothetical protein JTE90_005792 [Oedothorax gibbosus]